MSHMQSQNSKMCSLSTVIYHSLFTNICKCQKNTFTTSSMPTKHHNIEVSYVQSVWCIITISWKFRLIHRFRCPKCCWSVSFRRSMPAQMMQISSLAIMYHKTVYMLHWKPATTHCLTPWPMHLMSSWWKYSLSHYPLFDVACIHGCCEHFPICFCSSPAKHTHTW